LRASPTGSIRERLLDTIPAAVAERVEVMEGDRRCSRNPGSERINIVTKDFRPRDAQFTVGADSLTAGMWMVMRAIRSAHHSSSGSSDNSSGYRAFRPQDYQPSNTDRDRSYGVTDRREIRMISAPAHAGRFLPAHRRQPRFCDAVWSRAMNSRRKIWPP
jgi:hypothetical protein